MKRLKLFVIICFMGLGVGIAQPPPPHPGESGNQGAPVSYVFLFLTVVGTYGVLAKSGKKI